MLSEIHAFVNWLHRRNPDARTWRDYSYDLRQFVALVGDQPPETITFHDIDDFIYHQRARGFKPTTVNRRLAAISSLYAFLSDDDPNLVCPVMPHRHHLREPQRLPRPAKEDHLQRFFAVIVSPSVTEIRRFATLKA
ncbi:site-specific integrase [Chloroflexota bacterium]